MVRMLAASAACLLAGMEAMRLRKQEKSYRQVLHNFQNVQYFADFKIGEQDITGIFDTGSFELLVRSSLCQHCAHPTPPYDHSKSLSYIKNGTITRHVFGSGPCVSMMGYETVKVGPLVAKEQIVWEIIDHHISVLDTAKFAAIVGIGPNFAYDHKEDTLLMSYGVEQFSLCLQRESGSNGFLTWGSDLSEEQLQTQTVKANVIGKHHWSTRLHNVTFRSPGGFESTPCMDGCAAIIDSGTSLIAAPGAALQELSQQVAVIKEDCSNMHELPTLHFVIDGTPLELPPQAYVMRVTGAMLEANDIWDLLFFKPKFRRVDTCMPAFMQMDMMSKNGPVWILGMPFFRYFHTTFDRKNTAIHFSVAGPGCEPLPLKIQSNRTQSLLAVHKKSELYTPMEVDVGAIIPPRLSGMIDYPFDTNGEMEL